MDIRLIRAGSQITGGRIYEHFFVDSLSELLLQKGVENKTEIKLLGNIFRGWRNIFYLLKAWNAAKADVNIVVTRTALPAMIRNRFSKRKVVLILHYLDRKESKSFYLRLYYEWLFGYLRKYKTKNIAIVVVSPYFTTLCRRLFPQIPIFHIPNLFDNQKYFKFRQPTKNKNIHLGLWADKQDKDILTLAQQIKNLGFNPFFCSLSDEALPPEWQPFVRKFEFEYYLTNVAQARYTLSLTGINEGWGRLSHESLLLGTPLIAYNKGGLGDLVRLSGSTVVKNTQEALEIIASNASLPLPGDDFLKKYDISMAAYYFKPLIDFILADH